MPQWLYTLPAVGSALWRHQTQRTQEQCRAETLWLWEERWSGRQQSILHHHNMVLKENTISSMWSEFPAQAISTWKAQSRKTNPHTFTHLYSLSHSNSNSNSHSHSLSLSLSLPLPLPLPLPLSLSLSLSHTHTHLSHVLATWSTFCALFTWSWYTTCAKDHGVFLNYP